MTENDTFNSNGIASDVDVHVSNIRPLIPPVFVVEDVPACEDARATVALGRTAVRDVLCGRDDRVIVIAGPCSVHDPEAAIQYAYRLKRVAEMYADKLVVVMRVYFEKPRTTTGWKGFINDPGLDGTFDVNRGLRAARRVLRDINATGVPCACEFLDTITPQYIADLVTWGAIGARTVESQVHRELASGLSMPVGFKNTTDGNVQTAVDAAVCARSPHTFLGTTTHGMCAIVHTRGNPDGHVVLRGSRATTNYDAASVTAAAAAAHAANIHKRVVVDCSHDNSRKDHTKQSSVANAVASQIAAGSDCIAGVMIESNLVAGRQPIERPLRYGQSITDACIGWDETVDVIDLIARAVDTRRSRK